MRVCACVRVCVCVCVCVCVRVRVRERRSGADKVSIGSDAVFAAEAYYARGGVADGSTAIEQISRVYGKQAVVVRGRVRQGCQGG